MTSSPSRSIRPRILGVLVLGLVLAALVVLRTGKPPSVSTETTDGAAHPAPIEERVETPLPPLASLHGRGPVDAAPARAVDGAAPVVPRADRGERFEGTVFRGGSPATDVRVEAFTRPRSDLPWQELRQSTLVAETSTDASGRFRLRLASGEHLLRLHAGEHTPTTHAIVVPRDAGAVFDVEATATLVVRVVDPTGARVSSASVVVVDETTGELFVGTSTARDDARFANVPTHGLKIGVVRAGDACEVSGRAWWIAQNVPSWTPTAGTVTTRDVVSGAVRELVVARRSGGSVAGWAVRPANRAEAEAETKTLSPSGRIKVSTGPLEIRAPDGRTWTVHPSSVSTRIDVPDGTSGYRGVVRDASGRPLAGISLLARTDGEPSETTGHATTWLAFGRTDERGAFALLGLESARYALEPEPGLPGIATVGFVPSGPPNEAAALDLVIPAPSDPDGRRAPTPFRVVASNGEPLVRAIVVVEEIRAQSGGAWFVHEKCGSGYTDGDGWTALRFADGVSLRVSIGRRGALRYDPVVTRTLDVPAIVAGTSVVCPD